MSRGKKILELALLMESEGNSAVQLLLWLRPELVRNDDVNTVEQNDVEDIETDSDGESEKSDHCTDTEQSCEDEPDNEAHVLLGPIYIL